MPPTDGVAYADPAPGFKQEHVMPATVAAPADLDVLQALNRDYIASVQNCDVRRFDEILAEEFYCSNPDGTLVDRAGFLTQTARPVTIKGLRAEDVLIRMFGDVAIIHARTTYKTPDGGDGSGRYTDVWARRNGAWSCVSAHVTRV
jgi:ketosteroid isomerase-like protein